MRRLRAISPIGIEIGSRWIRAAQLSRTPKGWRLRAAARVPRSADTPLREEAARISGVLERRGFHGCEAVVAVPPNQIHSAVLELPPRSSGAPVEQLAAAEVARMHKGDPGAMEVALWEIPATSRAGAGCEYMVAACPHAAADEILDSFEAAGVRVRALDLQQLALLRACAFGVRPAPSMDAILHVGSERCALLIVTDGIIAYERALEGAEGRALVKDITDRLGADARMVEDLLLAGDAPSAASEPAGRDLAGEVRDFTTAHVASLVEQLNTSLSYISRRYQDRDLGTVLLTGEFGRLAGLGERIAALGVEARVVGAGDAVQAPDKAPEAASLGPSIIAAIGLAMHREREAA